MSDLLQLYQEIILNHNKAPRNYGKLEGSTGQAQGFNPLCGDEVTLYWCLQGDRLVDLSFEAQGCAISRASASLMTELLKGKSLFLARDLFQKLGSRLRDENGFEEVIPDEDWGDLAALLGVRNYPARIKCATLAWHTLLDNVAPPPGGKT